MKKLILGTFILLAFSAAVVISQMSCKKEAKADTPTGTPGLTQLNSVLIAVITTTGPSTQTTELRIVDLDGKLKNLIRPIPLPAGEQYAASKLSPDGKKILLTAVTDGLNGPSKLYIMNIDGSGLKEIFKTASRSEGIQLEGVY